VYYVKQVAKSRTNLSGDLAIIAGSDTTSNAIANILYFIMTNPSAHKRLQAEIDELGDNLMDCATQAHLPYLNAVM
jgi:cytochrome P450